jgi:hypothetical protein
MDVKALKHNNPIIKKLDNNSSKIEIKSLKKNKNNTLRFF